MGGRVRVHVENGSKSPAVFQVTAERLAKTLASHPDLADALDPSFGTDFSAMEPLRSAEFLVSFHVRRDLVTPQHAPRLAVIQVTGAGIDHLLPLSWLPDSVELANASGAHAGKVRDYATMALLALHCRLPFYATSKEHRRWERIFTPAIAGRTAAVLGVGAMGGAIAESAKALGLRVLGIRRNPEPHAAVDEMYATAQLDTVLPRADFMVVAAPLTSSTRGVIGRRQLDLLPQGAGLVNVGRGALVDYVALAEKLRSGALSGAVLDVFDPEPLPADSFLWDTPNLLITPHVSSDDAETYIAHVLDVLLENVRRYRRGDALINRIDRAREY
jgi:glyoxylate/hydroxypyruvate reductase